MTRPDRIALSSWGEVDPETGLVTIEGILDLPDAIGWNVQADVDVTSDQPEIVRLALIRHDQPSASMASTSKRTKQPVEPVPRSVTRALLQRLSITDIVSAVNTLLAFRQAPRRLPEPGEQRARSPEYYASMAARYVKHVDAGSPRARADFAREVGLSDTQARDLVQQLKRKGFITGGRHGVGSWRLTELARDELRRAR